MHARLRRLVVLVTAAGLLGLCTGVAWRGGTARAAADDGGDVAADRRLRRQRERDLYGDALPAGARARLGALRFVQPGAVDGIAVLPDGKTVVTLAREGPNPEDALVLRFWDAAGGRLRRATDLVGSCYYHTCFSADYRLAYVLGDISARPGEGGREERSQGIDLVEVATAKPLRRLGTHTGGFIETFAASPDGKSLAVAAIHDFPPRQTLTLWDADSGKVLRTIIEHEGSAGQSFPVRFSPDGKLLVTFDGNTIHLWDTRTGKELRRVEVPKKTGMGYGAGRRTWEVISQVNGVWFSRGSDVLVCTEDLCRDLHLYEVATGKELHRIPGGYTAVVFSADDKHLAAIAYKYDSHREWAKPEWGGIHVWETATGKEVAHFGKECGPAVLAFSPDGKTLFSGGHDGKVRGWEFLAGKLLPPAEGHAAGLRSVVFSPDGKELASAGDGICLWEATSGKQLRRFAQECYATDPDKVPQTIPPPRWFESEVRSGLKGVAFAPGGQHLVSWGWDELFRDWDAGSGKELQRVNGKRERGIDFCDALSPDGATLAVYGGTSEISLLDTEKGKEKGQCAGVFPFLLTFSADGSALAAAGQDAVCVWAMPSGKKLVTVQVEKYITALALSPDGRSFLTQASEGDAVFWDVATGKQGLTLPTGRQALYCLSPDGKSLAATDGQTGEIALWELGSLRERCRFAGHVRPVLCLTFSADGGTLASGGSDGTVLLWDLTRPPRDGGPAPPGGKLDARALEGLWAELTGADARRAFRAALRLIVAPEQSVPLLRERLAPAAPVPEERLTRLIANLDADNFDVREAATHELEGLGRDAESALRKAVQGGPSLEARRRIGRLLDKLAGPALSPEALRAVRATEVLERIGTPEARRLLAALAKGAPDARLTQEAKASLERLAARPLEKP